MTDSSVRFDTLEWLAIHPTAKPAEGCPGWYLAYDGPGQTGGPFWTIFARHRDGRAFDFSAGLWNRGPNFKYPLAYSFSHYLAIELHERYPDEYPDEVRQPDREPALPLDIHLNNAFDAFLNGDMEAFEAQLLAAKCAARPATCAEAA